MTIGHGISSSAQLWLSAVPSNDGAVLDRGRCWKPWPWLCPWSITSFTCGPAGAQGLPAHTRCWGLDCYLSAPLGVCCSWDGRIWQVPHSSSISHSSNCKFWPWQPLPLWNQLLSCVCLWSHSFQPETCVHQCPESLWVFREQHLCTWHVCSSQQMTEIQWLWESRTLHGNVFGFAFYVLGER